MSGGASHWSRVARSWSLVGPPLRPAAQDLALFQRAIADWREGAHGALEALILGVTPELCRELHWPDGSRVGALDLSVDMIKAVWPGASDTVRVGAWTDMPFAPASKDLILCDGGFGLLSISDQYKLLREIQRVLSPRGMFVVRLFAPMGRTGSLEHIATDLRAGRVASLDQLKLRLWGALQESAGSGVRPRDVVARIHEMSDDGRFLVDQLGWNPAHVEGLHLHRDSNAEYHLTDESDLADMVRTVPGLQMWSIARPSYDYGQCCPVVTMQRA